MLKLGRNIHFIGIGGIGMSGLAKVLLLQGYKISGSDSGSNKLTKALQDMGAVIHVGQKAGNIPVNCDMVVISSAINSDNPELVRAKDMGITVVKRGEVLAYLFNNNPKLTSVAIAGTHGKTTTTSLLSFIMSEIGLEPTSIVGGELQDFGSNVLTGKGNYIITEADESDGSFLHLKPEIAVITNIEEDHLDHYTRGLAQIIEAFENYVENSKFIVICGDDVNNQMLLLNLWVKDKQKNFVSYGFEQHNIIRADKVELFDGNSRYDLYIRDKFVATVTLSLGGRHNVLNSLAIISVIDRLFPNDNSNYLSRTLIALKKFGGVKRRFEKLAQTKALTIYDDYAHHPSEVKAVLDIAKSFNKPVITVFQPHRYSRLAGLFDDFSSSFGGSDVVIITDIYSAGEREIPGVSAAKLAESIKGYLSGKDVIYIADKSEIAPYILSKYNSGEEKIVILMGAGNLNTIVKDFN